jgi:hypothetical protein
MDFAGPATARSVADNGAVFAAERMQLRAVENLSNHGGRLKSSMCGATGDPNFERVAIVKKTLQLV